MTKEHLIKIKALHEMHGAFDEELIGKNGQMELEHHDEVSISFTCECGEKFYKKHKAERHLLENYE